VKYLLGLLTCIAGRNKKLAKTEQGGYVPLTAAFLQRTVRNYNQYPGYLQQAGVIETTVCFSPPVLNAH
jgi:hypothetical protein